MPRYIDKQKAVDALYGITEYKNTIPLSSAVFIIEKIPSADVVEVVRCKDCKWQGNDLYCPVCNLCGDDELPNGDWFCADGERREE